jgi:hypothetical protein
VPPACRLEGAGHSARAIKNSEGVKLRIFATVEHQVGFGYHHCRVEGDRRGMKKKPFWKGVKPGDLVRQGTWGSSEGDIGRVLAIAPVAGRWPDVLVILPGGDVQTWQRWGKVSETEAAQLADWPWKH